jgi:hypothetical protein
MKPVAINPVAETIVTSVAKTKAVAKPSSPEVAKASASLVAKEMGKTFAEPVVETFATEAAAMIPIRPLGTEVMKYNDTTESDWFNSMAADTFFNSYCDIDSMGLDVSDDGKDSIISVEKEIDSTPNEPVVFVYPFVAGNDMEDASKGLHLELLSFLHHNCHVVPMYQTDFVPLNPGQYLNNS